MAGSRRGDRRGESEGGPAFWFVMGFLSEFFWLVIVATEAGLASLFFGGRMEAASLGRISAMVVLYGLFSLLVLVPARHVAEGWLGMLAGRRPASYSEPAQNLGGGLCDLAMFAGFLVLVAVASRQLSEGEDPSAIAFGFSFTLFSLLVFGVGSAVPRLWFARRRAGPAVADPAPEILVQTGKRASMFCYVTFLGVGLALTGARVTARVRGLAAAPPHRGSAVPAPPPEPPLVKEFSGSVCADDRPGCHPYAFVSVLPNRTGPLSIQVFGSKDVPLCAVVPAGKWFEQDELARVDRRVNTAWNGGRGEVAVAGRPPVVVQVEAGTLVTLSMRLPEGAKRCGYHVLIRQPAHG